MKKILTALLAAALLLAASACGEKRETAEDYADKLVRGEVEPEVEIEEKTKAPEEKKSETKPAKVNLAVSEEEMGRLIDEAGNEYKSFTVQPIESPDFFVGKKLRVAAMIRDHQMTNVYESGIETLFTDDSLSISYNSGDEPTELNYLVYTVADKVAVSPENRQFSYVAYGDKEITSETTDGTIGVVASIKMREDVDMGAAAADSYIMLIETSNEGVYEILKVEE